MPLLFRVALSRVSGSRLRVPDPSRTVTKFTKFTKFTVRVSGSVTSTGLINVSSGFWLSGLKPGP